jgi:hypothetical protein
MHTYINTNDILNQEEKINGNAHIIAGDFRNARASATRCFSPPLNCIEKPPNH